MLTSDHISVKYLPVNDMVFIGPLTIADAEDYWELYQHPLIQRHFLHSSFEPGENEFEFTNRMLRSYNYIWTVRKYDDPRIIIGDCSLHDWDEQTLEAGISCALHPSHWGEGIMTDVMKYVINFAAEEMQIMNITAGISKYNDYAIRLMERLGFVESGKDGLMILFRKAVSK